MESVEPCQQVFTVGHSNHPIEEFVALLGKYNVGLVVDVRSKPASRHSRHFDRNALEALLRDQGIAYLFLGDELGGLPRDRAYYDPLGRVLYDKLAGSDAFRRGLDSVMSRSQLAPIALMCAEEDPARCHRHVLLAHALVERGQEVMHMRGDGTLESDAEVQRRRESKLQPTLF